MPTADESRPRVELDDFVRAFEASIADSRMNLSEFLPPESDPLYGPVLRELVRIDLEHRWLSGHPRALQEYRATYPQLFGDRESVSEIAFEEYRLRRLAGEDVTPAEYESRFGVDVANWPCQSPPGAGGAVVSASAATTPVETPGTAADSFVLAEAAAAYLKWSRGITAPADESREPSWDDFHGSKLHADVFKELHRSDPLVTAWLATALTGMPQAGGDFLGFPLLAELGSGAFGRVYLSRQGELADRLVVLKIVPHLFGESRTLARLQHPHIVPIYSVHQTDVFQAVCMPFLGTTTLADILRDLRDRPEMPDSGRYLIDRIQAGFRSRQAMATPAIVDAEAALVESTASFAPLAKLSYVDAILSIAVRLADALAHAHGRGIVHRDLKPANILLTDDGRPMLLDFNLSEDDKLHRSASAARVGGTLPYMAPEQLEAFQSGEFQGDERSDLYSLGIILFELLTGRDSMVRQRDTAEGLLQGVIADRQRPPSARRWNGHVSPAVESILHHCLEPEPDERYQSAEHLSEDLRRHLDHRHLRYAKERSRVECAKKWVRRYPRLSSAATVGMAAAVITMAILVVYTQRTGKLARLAAEQTVVQTRLRALAARRALHDDLRSLEFLLGSRVAGAEREQRAEGLRIAWRAMGRFRVLESPAWQETPLFTAMTAGQREQVMDDMGELFLLVSGALARDDQIESARRFNDMAAACYPRDDVPRAVWAQRTGIERLAGRHDEERRFAAIADRTPAESPRERSLLLLTQFSEHGRFPDNLRLLEEASRANKDNFALWLMLGNGYAEIGKRKEAVDCYEMAAALRPDSHWPPLCRGLTCLELRDDRQARAAFDEVIRLEPGTGAAYYNRALASYHLGDYSGARADLTHLIDGPDPPLRAFLLRARVRARLGDPAGAARDRELGVRGEPRDARDWTARGLERQPRDPQGALADYQAALKLDPRYRTALQNMANVLAENLGRTAEAIAALDTLLAIAPNDVPARAGRGVLHARLGHREAALADARQALQNDETPLNTYQVAGIYALTSIQHSGDRREALRLLESALRRGFGLDLVEKDHDLDAIRHEPEFQQIVEAARAQRAGSSIGEKKRSAGKTTRTPTIQKVQPVSNSG